MQKDAMVWEAYHYYKSRSISIGQVEALSIAIARAKYDEHSQKWKNIHMERNEDVLDQVISACKEIRNMTDALKAKKHSQAQIQMLFEIESFYGFHKRIFDTEYSIPRSSYPWTNGLLKEPVLEDTVEDSDGMLQLKLASVRKGIYNRLQMFVEKWIVDDEYNLIQNFHKALTQHSLHSQMISGGYLTECIPFSNKSSQFQQYFDMLSQAYSIAHYGNTQFMSETATVKAVLSIISPQATCFMPVSSLKINSDPLVQRLHEEGSCVLAGNDDSFVFDQWYEAWCINCVTKKGRKLEDALSTRSANTNRQTNQVVNSGFQVYKRQRSQDPSSRNIPSVYVLVNDEYKHLMLLWMTTCKLIREKRMLPSCTIAVHNVLRPIALNRSIWTTVSVSNLLHIVTIHSTALLTMYATCCACLQHEGNVYMPSSYRNVIEVFQNMNSVPATQSGKFLGHALKT